MKARKLVCLTLALSLLASVPMSALSFPNLRSKKTLVVVAGTAIAAVTAAILAYCKWGRDNGPVFSDDEKADLSETSKNIVDKAEESLEKLNEDIASCKWTEARRLIGLIYKRYKTVKMLKTNKQLDTLNKKIAEAKEKNSEEIIKLKNANLPYDKQAFNEKVTEIKERKKQLTKIAKDLDKCAELEAERQRIQTELDNTINELNALNKDGLEEEKANLMNQVNPLFGFFENAVEAKRETVDQELDKLAKDAEEKRAQLKEIQEKEVKLQEKEEQLIKEKEEIVEQKEDTIQEEQEEQLKKEEKRIEKEQEENKKEQEENQKAKIETELSLRGLHRKIQQMENRMETMENRVETVEKKQLDKEEEYGEYSDAENDVFGVNLIDLTADASANEKKEEKKEKAKVALGLKDQNAATETENKVTKTKAEKTKEIVASINKEENEEKKKEIKRKLLKK